MKGVAEHDWDDLGLVAATVTAWLFLRVCDESWTFDPCSIHAAADALLVFGFRG